MKKLFFLLLPLLSLAACTPEYDNVLNDARQAGADEAVEFYATVEGSDTGAKTKVYADEDLLVLWNAGDLISIFNEETVNLPYLFKGEEGDNAGGFSNASQGYTSSGDQLSYIYSLYPYDERTQISNQGVISFNLPALQHYKANTFGIGANTMVSVTRDNFLQFKNAGSYLALRFYGEGVSVKRISLCGNSGEKLAGNAAITMAIGGTPVVTMQEDATNVITLECDTPIALGADENNCVEFWFVVPPTSFEYGFTVTVTDAIGRVFRKSTSQEVTLERNQLHKMMAMQVSPTHQIVDLGLSVKWATCNLGATCPEELGDPFAWGETSPKSEYNWRNYKFYISGSSWTDIVVSKYNTQSKYGNVDYINSLELSDDAAQMNWGGKWRMPTMAELKELMTKCTWKRMTPGKNGYLVTGPNGNSIFLPGTGDFLPEYGDYNTFGSYWSSSLNTDRPDHARGLGWDPSDGPYEGGNERYRGEYVRPVYDTNISKPAEVVDLGLSVKWASFNVGASCPEDYGDYFAWGETLQKQTYSWATYQLSYGSYSSLTKYNNNGAYGTVDNESRLELSNDAARVNWGENWRMPTDEELTELRTQCDWRWTTQRGKKGYLVTGPNGNSIFLPAAGYQDESGLILADSEGWYWSASLGAYPYYASRLALKSNNISFSDTYRACGLSVRPVYDENDNRPSIPTPKAMDLGLSVKWASFNLGASSPDECGDYFAWGETKAKSTYTWENYKFWVTGSYSSNVILNKYNTYDSHGTVDNKTQLDLTDDAARSLLKDKWRIPTDTEWEELRTQCTWEWVGQNDMNGYKVTAKNGNSIFLPAAGSLSNSRYQWGAYGYYWSSVLDAGNPVKSWSLDFSNAYEAVYMDNIEFRYVGLSIRPVTE